MKNITLAIDEEVLAKVRRLAAQKDTTVNGMVREYLTDLATREDRAKKARERLVQLAKQSNARLGPDWKWNREELYDRSILSGHQRAAVRGGRTGGRTGKAGEGD